MRRRKTPVVRIAVGDSLADVERRLIQRTLRFARGNKKKTAELLKLSLKTIYNKIKERPRAQPSPRRGICASGAPARLGRMRPRPEPDPAQALRPAARASSSVTSGDSRAAA
jgi:hypothetical protein